MQKRILVGDDHPIIRKGLRALLDYYFKSIEVREACSCAEIMRELSHSRFSHLLLDIVLSDGTILEIFGDLAQHRQALSGGQNADIFHPARNNLQTDITAIWNILLYFQKSWGRCNCRSARKIPE
jgi:hypothetical protein